MKDILHSPEFDQDPLSLKKVDPGVRVPERVEIFEPDEAAKYIEKDISTG